MKAKMKFKRIVACLIAAGALALSANAQAMTYNAGTFGSTPGDLGTATNPIVINGGGTNLDPDGLLFLDTINFDLGTNNYFNMRTSGLTNVSLFKVPIFENNGDTQVVAGKATHLDQFLPDLHILDGDYHLHPQGLAGLGNYTYTVTLWGSATPAAVPIPAAVYLFGTGLIGLIGLARRKMRAAA